MLDRVLATIDSRRQASLDLLKEFLRIPSVSTKPEHKPDMVRCADWLADQLRQCGLTPAVYPTAGHPIVVAKNEHRPGRPTVLVYGHYDVQPPEPLELWASPPFEPTVRNDDAGHDAVFARGAVDDKGQVWCHVEAIRAFAAHGGVPVNLTVLIEGEEEIGSEHFEAFAAARRDELRADVCVVSDTNQFARGVPAITCGLRGIVYEEVVVRAAAHDLHSGLYGGAVVNPANVLCALVASLHNPDGSVNVPGFYADVREPSAAERAAWAGLPHDDAAFAASIGADAFALAGEAGYTTLERTWVRPTCDVNGLTAGYQGAGAKTVIGGWASAKVSMRLVPDQDPEAVRRAFEAAVRDRCPPGVRVEFRNFGLNRAIAVPPAGRAVELAAAAVEAGFGARPVLVRSGGIIGAVEILKRVVGVDTLLVGFGLPDDRIHAPNEKFDLGCLRAGTRTAAHLYAGLAGL